MEITLPYRLHCHQHRPLHHSIPQTWYTQGPQLAVCFWYIHASCWQRSVRARQKLRAYRLKFTVKVSFHHVLVDTIHTRRVCKAIAGIGPITASAFVATVGDAKSFKNARQVPAWLGMVPRQDGTGGKVTLGRISKRGDVYLRTMLIHGARAVIAQFERKPDQADGWLTRAPHAEITNCGARLTALK